MSHFEAVAAGSVHVVKSSSQSEQDALRTLLSSHGLRVTGQRLIVLRELARCGAPTSHSELSRRLARSRLDRTTVYRNLVSLAAAGLLVKTRLGGQVWLFGFPQAPSLDHAAHPHFICDECGTVLCMPEDAVTVCNARADMVAREIQLRGRCPTCSGNGPATRRQRTDNRSRRSSARGVFE
jgi:Fur family transcriptional regulator, ferric uptake regulator